MYLSVVVIVHYQTRTLYKKKGQHFAVRYTVYALRPDAGMHLSEATISGASDHIWTYTGPV